MLCIARKKEPSNSCNVSWSVLVPSLERILLHLLDVVVGGEEVKVECPPAAAAKVEGALEMEDKV